MKVIIRTEKYSDIHQIAEINALAFKNSNPLNEVILVDSLRHRKEFDPELSLVAEVNGEVIGHILFF
ncbi:GNAT family N-acetyltransferase [Haloplasma contractile]|uniref:GCN5-related N-acetyltransferase protein n=1 Tax=Haloplasma contractile SSD-17B TaxID=1033810 RepID=U2FLG3_9MOLU|nr:GCN5-like N-acetyltransferase [Haloplasma contractile]ERJ12014.1 GCN5-related N-acetyltransferase protein [Haloplasma contractile SSD-17B]